jgi:hypothetical protein
MDYFGNMEEKMKNKLIKILIITFILLFSYMNICYGVTVNEEPTGINVYIESACFMFSS